MRVIVTDNYMDAQRVYPGDRILTKTAEVLDLGENTEVIIHQVKIGYPIDDAIKAAEVLIDRKDLRRAEA